MSNIDFKTICSGCGDLTNDGFCMVWGPNAKHQLFIKHGGFCLRNDRRTWTKTTKKVNPIKNSKRSMR